MCSIGPSTRRVSQPRPRSFCYNQHYFSSSYRRRTQLAPVLAGGAGGDSGNRFTAAVGQSPGDGGFQKGRWKLIFLIAAGAVASVVNDSLYKPGQRAAAGQVSIVIPALNEEKCIKQVVSEALNLQPRPAEVIVVDGGSSDRTIELAAAAGANVISSARGRANQMNAGAKVAKGDILAFLHADTHPPPDLVSILRHELSRPTTVLLGFRPTIQGEKRTLWFFSIHNMLKSYYLPMIMRPLSYVRGLRVLFGDQLLCCRKADFNSVGGFDESLPIMEDADLCIRLHNAGPASALHHTRGRVKQVLNRTVVTSGRRLEAWGELYGTWVHFVIGLCWYIEKDPHKLKQLYHSMYTDKFR